MIDVIIIIFIIILYKIKKINRFDDCYEKEKVIQSYLKDFEAKNIYDEILYILCARYRAEFQMTTFVEYSKLPYTRHSLKIPNYKKILPVLIKMGYLEITNQVANQGYNLSLTLSGIRLIEINHILFIFDISKLKYKWYIKFLIKLKFSGIKSKINIKTPIMDSEINFEQI